MEDKIIFWVYRLKNCAKNAANAIEGLHRKNQNIFYTMCCFKNLVDSTGVLVECVYAFIADIEGV